MSSAERVTSNGENGAKFFPGPEILKARLNESPSREAILGYLKQYGVKVDQFLPWPEKRGLYLSDLGILRHLLAGNIVIEPFDPDRLTPNSYEVSLGEFYYRQKNEVILNLERRYQSPRQERGIKHFAATPRDEERTPIFNPFDHYNLQYIWKLGEAVRAGDFEKENAIYWEGIDENEKVIMVAPNEMILAHTQEFIGGQNVVSTLISAKSSTGRNLLEVCNDANLGHIGFINRWTLEVRNKSDNFANPLVVGRPYAQISFLETEPSAQSYQGQYQRDFDIKKVMASWRPELMLTGTARTFPQED